MTMSGSVSAVMSLKRSKSSEIISAMKKSISSHLLQDLHCSDSTRKLFDLPIDCLSVVFLYLSADDFCRVTCTNRYSYFAGEKHMNTILQQRWEVYCLARWGLAMGSLEIPKECRLRLLYPYMRPLPVSMNTFGIEGFRDVIDEDNLKIVQDGMVFNVLFTGRVGESNRSVQSTIPFPAVNLNQQMHKSVFEYLYHYLCTILLFLQELHLIYEQSIVNSRSRNSSSSSSNSSSNNGRNALQLKSLNCQDNKHCTPFLYYSMGGRVFTCITPRAISYYEVRVKQGNSVSSSNNNNNNNDIATDCVAVGLSSCDFESHTRLPGWDYNSYGYHGDDGAIYHGKGHKLSSYGPAFTVGDIVGCGLNHRERSIFFTLNGVFLGTAFQSVKPGIELYPTVGIDMTNGSVDFNFGCSTPFVFDLMEYIELDEDKEHKERSAQFLMPLVASLKVK